MNLNWTLFVRRFLYGVLRVWILLVLLISVVISSSAHAACSSWRSPQKAWFNEYFFGSGGSAPPNFLEVYSTSNAFPASWQNWSIDVYTGANTKTTYPLTSSTSTACTVSNKTWLTTNVPGGLRQQNALVLLKDEAGAYVDAFVFDNSSPPDPWPGAAASSWFPGLANASTGCPALATSLTSQAGTSGSTPKQFNMLVLKNYGNKDMARDPDGGSTWDLTSNTGSGTTYTQCVSNNANFTKTVDNATPTPGTTVTFTLNLANTSSTSMAGVQITDFLPPILTYISSTSSNASDPPVTTGTYTATDPNTGLTSSVTSVNWSPATVAAGTISKLNIKMQVPADAPEGHTYVNTAQTTAGLTDSQTDFANVTIGSPNTPSFAISVSPATSTTCTPALLGPQVTITAMSAANGTGTPLTNYNGTVTLTASTPSPRWYNSAGVRLSGNTVTLTNGSITLYLADTVAETFTVSAVDAVYASPNVMQGSSGNITFTAGSTGLTLTDVDILTPNYGAVAGRPHAVRANVSTCGSTATTTGQYSGTIYYIPGLNHPAGATGPTINTSSASCPGSVVAPLTTGGTPITLNFSAGRATFYLCSTDVGQYALRLSVSGIPSGTNTVTGTSSNFTVRPFVITASGFMAGSTANPAGTAALAKAGASFSGTLSAWRWVASADTETDGSGAQRGNGIPDANATASTITTANPGLTARFNGTTNNAGVVSLASVLAPPVNAPTDTTAYTLGTLSPTTATLATGTATLTNAISYSEVGNFKIGGTEGGGTYAVTNYLGAAGLNVPILSDVVGRITPDHFTVTAPNIIRRPGCSPDSTFTYMDEIFSLGFTLAARNASGVAMQNYRNSYAFLNLFDPNDTKWASMSVADRNARFAAQWASTSTGADGSFGLGAYQDPSDLSSRIAVTAAAGSGWVNGANTINANARFARTAAAQDGPFATLTMGIVPRDTDGITVKPADLNLNGNRVSLGTNNLRFGRLVLFSASAQGQANINMPVQAQYWSGKSWILNKDDNCTLIAAGALRAANYRDGRGNAMAAWPVTLGGAVQITGGLGQLSLTKPGTVRAGTVDVCVDLGNDPAPGVACAATPGNQGYLKGRWAPGTTFQNDPAASASFGVYTPETQRAVHIRELY
ncbi:DUF11 domain-containing protein [Noviherbaspirillum saxi]|uniref:DUF11 domain-containing protein n=1 Tax=Noviherbaspirillum saxi TaxID=2320863 RepID=A0A3A3FS15_9BURK|nr:DUF11 domain-containing protein [Noviherbaspirillum saxi]RJF98846.1 DUF11 domain-containing protein [Noviherbaspirillum saxi]